MDSQKNVTAASTYGAVDLSAMAPATSRPEQKPGAQGASPQAGAARTGGPGAAGQAAGAGPAAALDLPLIVDADMAGLEAAIQTSLQVPVIVDFWATWCQPCKQLGPILEEAARQAQGAFQLVKVDIDANQEVAAAFQVQSVPTVIALLGGRPVPLFQGAVGKTQVQQVVEQLLQAAAQMGVTGRLRAPGEAAQAEISAEDARINQAVEAGDWQLAESLVRKALTNNPAEKTRYRAQLAQVQLQGRLEAAQGTTDDTDPLQLADRFVAAGNEAAAYGVLLDAVAAGGEGAEEARERLVQLFAAGVDTEAVKQARAKLAALLF